MFLLQPACTTRVICYSLPGVELLGLLLQAGGLKGGEAPEGHVQHSLCLLLAQAELLLQCFRGSSTCAAPIV